MALPEQIKNPPRFTYTSGDIEAVIQGKLLKYLWKNSAPRASSKVHACYQDNELICIACTNRDNELDMLIPKFFTGIKKAEYEDFLAIDFYQKPILKQGIMHAILAQTLPDKNNLELCWEQLGRYTNARNNFGLTIFENFEYKFLQETCCKLCAQQDVEDREKI